MSQAVLGSQTVARREIRRQRAGPASRPWRVGGAGAARWRHSSRTRRHLVRVRVRVGVRVKVGVRVGVRVRVEVRVRIRVRVRGRVRVGARVGVRRHLGGEALDVVLLGLG